MRDVGSVDNRSLAARILSLCNLTTTENIYAKKNLFTT
jgi:hypothetical protein